MCARFATVRPARALAGRALAGARRRRPGDLARPAGLRGRRARTSGPPSAPATCTRSTSPAGSRRPYRRPAARRTGSTTSPPSAPRWPGATRARTARWSGSPATGCTWPRRRPSGSCRREGRRVWSSPIKGTAPVPEAAAAKDRAENVMIVDLVRNDLGRVCEFGSVRVPALLEVEPHPGLVHLVSTVEGRLRPGLGWAELHRGHVPARLGDRRAQAGRARPHRRLEPVPRGVYCGAVGWVDADAARRATSTSPSARSGSRTAAALRHRRRHHLGLRPRPASGRRPS